MDVNEYYGFYLALWLGGAVAALLRVRCGWLKTVSWRISSTLLLLAIALGSAFPNLVLAGGRVFGPAENLMQLVIAAFCASLALPNLRLGDNTGGRALAWLGAHSYTLYIVHFPIMLLVLSLYQQFAPLSLQSSIITALLAVVLCVAVSSTSAKFFENKKLFAGWLESGLSGVENYGTRLWSR
jgi:peptidoglycan/LPS O-acetylase OafA/YrhL